MELQDYLAECTVRIDTDARSGTGFFVAPGLVLTPAHVVEDPNSGRYPFRTRILVSYGGKQHPARLVRYAASPKPDLAILAVDLSDHAVAYLFGPVRSDDPLFVTGFKPSGGDAVRHVFEGAKELGSNIVLRAESGIGAWDRVMDGAPVLNLRTGGVCALVTRIGEATDDAPSGGRRVRASRVSEIDSLFPGARDAHDAFHENEPRWFESSGVVGTIFAARTHMQAMRETCQKPIQPLLSPRNRAGAVDLLAPIEFRVLGDKSVEREAVSLDGLLDRCRSDGSRVMIVGPSGSGRSSLLRHVAYRASIEAGNPGVRGREVLFPILIRANQLASRSGGIEDQILAAMKTSAFPVSRTLLPSTFLSDLAETPGLLLLLMIDGLDEIQNSRDMADIVDVVGRIQVEPKFGHRIRIVVTSRPATAEHFRYARFDVFEIQPMSDAAIRTAAEQWLGADTETFLAAHGPTIESGMLRSPLTLSIALTLHEQGAGRGVRRLVDLYQGLVDLGVARWKTPAVRDEYGPEIVDHAEDILGFLALELLRAALVQTRDWVAESVTRYFIQHLKVSQEKASGLATTFLGFAQRESMFLRVSGDRLFWSHQSFQDYFAARRLTSSEHEVGNAVKAIRARWFDFSRGHAPAFATAMLPELEEREAIVREILSSGRKERFDFVTRLLVDGVDLSGEVVSTLISDLVAAARVEKETYGTELRPSPRASFAIDLLASLGHLPEASEALSQIVLESDWPARVKERARTA